MSTYQSDPLAGRLPTICILQYIHILHIYILHYITYYIHTLYIYMHICTYIHIYTYMYYIHIMLQSHYMLNSTGRKYILSLVGRYYCSIVPFKGQSLNNNLTTCVTKILLYMVIAH